MLFLRFTDEEVEDKQSQVCGPTSQNFTRKRCYVSLGLFLHHNRLQSFGPQRGGQRIKTCLLGGKNKPWRKWETQECASLLFIFENLRRLLKTPFGQALTKGSILGSANVFPVRGTGLEFGF